MEYFRQLIAEKHLHHTFWCFNANSGDTGGLVKDDFKTWDEEKYNFVKEVLWQTEDGKFIGLDHAVPLGANGIALSDYSGVTVTPSPARPSSEVTEEVTESSAITSETVSEETVEASVQGEESGSDITAGSLQKAAVKLIVVVVIAGVILIIVMALLITLKIRANRKRTAREEIVLPDPEDTLVDREAANVENTAGESGNNLKLSDDAGEDD